MPQFSIVTSFYNESVTYIERLYQNILQTGVDWEWVVTDDFSNNIDIENALDNLSKKDSRVRRIIQSEKREIFRNPSLYCRGEFIFHIDGDDLFHPLYLKQTRMWFEKFPDVVCIVSGGVWRSERGYDIRYVDDDPFCLPHVKDGISYPVLNYLGRIWRSRYKIDFSQIFSNEQDILRFNDRFIVEYLSTRGEILHLPRCNIVYTTRTDSNTHRERSNQETESINRTLQEFDNWYEKNLTIFPKNPHFFTGETSFFNHSITFQHIGWSNKKRKCGVFGFSPLKVLRKLLVELYPDLDIIFDPSENLFDGIPVFVVDNLERIDKLPNNCQVYYCTSDSKEKEFFFNNILGVQHTRWLLSEEVLWICFYK